MARIVLVTGGARSGKSRLAEERVRRMGGTPTYIATAEPLDAEMKARIAAHRTRRGADWITRAEPLDIAAVLDDTDGGGPRLVDCLTIWLSNLIHTGRDCEAETRALCDALARQRDPVVLVTNEVGAGIVPENALARRFRDSAGWTNQRIARAADEVILCVAGCPVQVKPGR